MKKKTVIGIDPGTATGIAIVEHGDLVNVATLHHNYAFDFVETYLIMSPAYEIFIVIEDARKRSGSQFKYADLKNGNVIIAKNEMQKLQNVGKVKMLCNLWEEWAEQYGKNPKIYIDFIQPLKKTFVEKFGVKLDSKSKIPMDEFTKLTKWDKKCSQHARDAGVIAKTYAPNKLKFLT